MMPNAKGLKVIVIERQAAIFAGLNVVDYLNLS
jgi:hypothetical protein